MTITNSAAHHIAVQYLKALEARANCELVLLEEQTIERNFGWVFFYDSKRHVQTGKLSDMLAGNAPIVITRADGHVHETGTAQPLEHYLERFTKHSSHPTN